MRNLLVVVVLLWSLPSLAGTTVSTTRPTTRKSPTVDYEHTKDVIYGRSHGLSLTLDVLRPKGAKAPNGAGAIFVTSGGYASSPARIRPLLIELYMNELLRRGYTIFIVVHGSVPKFTIPEAVADVNRAVRFIRHNAKTYGIDPEQLGIYGTSAGGHLSLMIGCAGTAGNPKSDDPVERESSRVGAVAAFYAPTDYLNFEGPGKPVDLVNGYLATIRPAFDFHEYNRETRRYERITDEKRFLEILRQNSPLHQLDRDDPPVLLIHGTKDHAVFHEQSVIMLDALKRVGVEGKLITHEGRGHGWTDTLPDIEAIGDWFDRYVRRLAPAATTRPTSSTE